MIHNKRLNIRTYLVIFFFTIVIFFCAAIAFSQPIPPIKSDLPPQHITLNGETWTLVHRADNSLDPFLGITYCVSRRIYYESRLNVRSTIVHELLHANTCKDGELDNFYYNSADEDHHAGYYNISQFFTNLAYDNPQLMNWLKNTHRR